MNLILSMVRITPKKIMWKPWLELLGVLIEVRSSKFLSRQLEITDIKQTLWTDYKELLNWIKNKKPLSVLVQDWITEINNTNVLQWWKGQYQLKNPSLQTSRVFQDTNEVLWPFSFDESNYVFFSEAPEINCLRELFYAETKKDNKPQGSLTIEKIARSQLKWIK